MALEGLGSVESAQGRNAEAETLLREAVSIREKTPDDIWELAQAQERLGEVLAKSGSAEAPAHFEEGEHRLGSRSSAPIIRKLCAPKPRSARVTASR